MRRERSYISPYDLDGATQNGSYGSSSPSSNPKHPQQNSLLGLKVLLVLLVAMYAAFNIYEQNPEKILKMKEQLLLRGDDSNAETGDEGDHEDEGNIMILGPPWVYLRDGVNDMPVQDNDVTFFWMVRGASGEMIRNMFTDCLDLTLTLYHHGIDVEPELSSLSRTYGIASPNIREVAGRFSSTYYGRMFAFFRHPYQIYKESPVARSADSIDNPLVRHVIGVSPDVKIGYVELGIAKKVIREKCIVGLLDEKFEESVKRIYEYFGWMETDGMGVQCFSRHRSTIPKDPYGDYMSDNSPEWVEFMKSNKYDLQLYEFARSVFRAHAQTIIPRYKQLAAEEEEEEEDEDEEEEEDEE